MHLFVAGTPRAGKTTFIKYLIEEENFSKFRGFYTEEIRRDSQRVGFKVKTLGGDEKVFAHKDFKTPHKVSHYNIKLKVFEEIAVNELKLALASQARWIIIDEIGKMELFSEKFKEAVGQALEKKEVIAAIPLKYENEFLTKIKGLDDICLLELGKENFCDSLEKGRLFLKAKDTPSLRALDAKAKTIGFSETILIENASSNLCSVIESLNLGKNALVIAGRGNNGADVLSCARKLLSRGYKVDIAVVANKELNQEVKFQLGVLEKIKSIYPPAQRIAGKPAGLHFIKDDKDILNFRKLLKNRDFILEGILGTGMKGELRPFIKKIIQEINKNKARVISCDIPSGLSPCHGQIGAAIKADYTITFIAPKKGFFKNRGLDFCGKIFNVDIGISAEILEGLSRKNAFEKHLDTQ